MSNVPLILPSQYADAETIHDVELAYHRYVLARVKLLADIEAQIAALQKESIAIGGARDSWMAHLSQRYALENGDQITSEGQIVRANPPALPDPDPGA